MQKGSSHQGREHTTAQKTATAKTSSRKSIFGRPGKPHLGRKSPTRTREGKNEFLTF